VHLDEFDRKLLRLLQVDGRLTNNELSQKVNLSASQCSRRRTRLEQDGYIRGYRADLDREKLGVGIVNLITVTCAVFQPLSAMCCCRMNRCSTSRPRSSSTRLKRAARFLSDRRDDGSRRQFTHWSRGRHASGGGRPKKICIRLEPNAAASVPMFGASAKMLAEIRLKRC
jgi:DNA-binding Lrp family transcriptional regulator